MTRLLRVTALVVAIPLCAVVLIGVGAGFIATWLICYAEDGEWPR